jgi:hypothetical protein
LSSVGAWKNFDELEESLTLSELMEIDKAISMSEWRLNRVIAGTVGVELPDPSGGVAKTIDDVRRQALGDDPEHNDIVGLQGKLAEEQGFGVGLGLGYEVED